MAVSSQPFRSSPAALRKASQAMASASATSVAATVSARVTPDIVSARRSSDAISAVAIAGSAESARAGSKSARTAPQARQPPRRGTVSRTA